MKKEARGIDADLGPVEAISADPNITKESIIHKDRFYTPKNLVEQFDGEQIWLNLTQKEAQAFKSSYDY